MRTAYALLGILWVIVIGATWWGTHGGFTEPDYSATITSTTTPAMSFTLTSTSFEADGSIPSRYTCDDRRDLNPPLTIANVPEGAKSLALIMDDPDVPKALKPDGVFDHWVVYAIPPQTLEIQEGAHVGVTGLNSAGKTAYTGPCPPSEYEPKEHRYVFTIYAVKGSPTFTKAPTKGQLLAAIQDKILAKAVLTGRYAKKQ